jgi:uncharacterized protein YndB with AHSA1/START domain
MTTTDGRAVKKRETFRMECGVSINIRAQPERVWSLLTDAAAFPRWNSTVTSIEGQIALGQKIKLRVPLAPKRVFKLKVSEFEPGARMVWSDGAAPMFRGVRTFTLSPRDNGSIDFAMVEVFSGLMLPMIAGSLPDFAPSFERYAADLKLAAEKG